MVLIGRNIEIKQDEDTFMMTTFFPDSVAINQPWRHKKIISQKDSKKMTDRGVELSHLFLNFKYPSTKLKYVKIFFDSYQGAFLDETFFSQFSDSATKEVMYLPFEYIKPNSNGVQEWKNSISNVEIKPTSYWDNSGKSYKNQISVRRRTDCR